MKPVSLILFSILGLNVLDYSTNALLNHSMSNINESNSNSTKLQVDEENIKQGTIIITEPFSTKMNNCGFKPGQTEKSSPAVEKEPITKRKELCGNVNKEHDRCLYSCISGGFFHGICTESNECFCHNKNPNKGFIIERKQPVLRRVKTKNSNEKEITVASDDYSSGYVDVDVQFNFEWDLSYVKEWFQSFNLYKRFECDPCLCRVGCAVYGYFSGYCTPRPSTDCLCATPHSRTHK